MIDGVDKDEFNIVVCYSVGTRCLYRFLAWQMVVDLKIKLVDNCYLLG